MDFHLNTRKICIIGAGSWGTTLGLLMSRSDPTREIVLYTSSSDLALLINESHIHPKLNNIILPSNISATTNPSIVINCNIIFISTQAENVSIRLKDILVYLPKSVLFVLCSKGIGNVAKQYCGTKYNSLLSKIVYTEAVIAGITNPQIAVLSGPNFATDIAHKLPSITCIGCKRNDSHEMFNALLLCDHFRIEYTHDVYGVEICGIIKNILAIASGIIHAANFGKNMNAAFICAGFKEMRNILSLCNASPDTAKSAAGIGDLILTCGNTESRNMNFGITLTNEKYKNNSNDISLIISEKLRGQTIEGYNAAVAFPEMFCDNTINTTNFENNLANNLISKAPICYAIHQILVEQKLSPERLCSTVLESSIQ